MRTSHSTSGSGSHSDSGSGSGSGSGSHSGSGSGSGSTSGSRATSWQIAAALLVIAVIAAAFAVARGLASAAAGARVLLIVLTVLAGIGAAALIAPPTALAAAACRLRSAVGAQPPALCRGAARVRRVAQGLHSSLTESGFDTDLAGEGPRPRHRSSGFCPAAGSGEIAGGCAADAVFDATGPGARGADSLGAPIPYPGWVGVEGGGAARRAADAPGEPPVTTRAGAGGASAAGEPPMYGVDGYGAPLAYLGNYRETSYANGNTNPRALRAASDTCDNSANHGPYAPGDLLAQVEYDLFGESSEGDPLGQFAPPCAGSLRDASAAELATGDERMAREGTVRNDAARAAAAALNRRRDLDSVFREELVSEENAVWWGRDEY